MTPVRGLAIANSAAVRYAPWAFFSLVPLVRLVPVRESDRDDLHAHSDRGHIRFAWSRILRGRGGSVGGKGCRAQPESVASHSAKGTECDWRAAGRGRQRSTGRVTPQPPFARRWHVHETEHC